MKAIRARVRRFGIFIGCCVSLPVGWCRGAPTFYPPWAGSSMQGAMNRLGQGVADAGHPGQLLAAGLPDALQAAEEAQQLPAALGAHAEDALQGGGAPNLVAAGAVAGDGEAVSLVADMLDQVQQM